MGKRVADMTPEELERVRKYRRERPIASRPVQRQKELEETHTFYDSNAKGGQVCSVP
jgi:hypothetical protein